MSSIGSLLDTIRLQTPPYIRRRLGFLKPVFDDVRQRFGDSVVQTNWGPTIRVDSTDHVEYRIATGDFERATIEYVLDTFTTGYPRVCDVGANIGFYSLLLAQRCSEVQVINAFEPLPWNVRRFEQNIELNDVDHNRITVHPFGLSDVTKETELTVSESNHGESTMAPVLHSSKADRTVGVEMKRMDDVYENRPDPELLKIDVEGAEVAVLCGGREMLERNTPDLLLELHPQLITELNDSLTSLVSLLEEVGYSNSYHIEEDSEYPVSALTDVRDGEDKHFHIY